MPEFDPYLKWLGIRDHQRPPNHYRLLGIEVFEDDLEVISAAADRQMSYIRTFQTGPNGETSQRIMSELAEARRCLLNQETKSAYDQGLRASLAGAATKIGQGYDPSDLSPPGAGYSMPTAPSKPNDLFIKNSTEPDREQNPTPVDGPESIFPTSDTGQPIIREPSSPGRRRRKRSSGFLPQLIGIVGGGVAAVIVSYYIINSGFLDQFRKVAKQDVIIADPGKDKHEQNSSLAKPDPNTGDASKTKNPKGSPRIGSAANNKDRQNRARDNQTPQRNKPKQSPSPRNRRSANLGQAPWDANRFPTLPDHWLRPRTSLDKALQPLRIHIANRRFREAESALRQARLAIAKSDDETEYDQLLVDLTNFWNQTVSASKQLPVGTELDFRDQKVKIVAKSNRSIRLQHGNKIRIFPTTIDKLDRDLAVAIAKKIKTFDDDKINKLIAWDYNHIQLTPDADSFFAKPNNRPNDNSSTAVAKPTRSSNSDSNIAKAPVPGKSEISKVKKEIRELFPSAYDRSTSNVELVRVASQMIQAAKDTNNKLDQYVTLTEGLKIAGENGAATVSIEGLQLLRNTFDVDFWAITEDQLNLLTRSLRDPVQADSCLNEMLGLAESAEIEQQFDVAINIADKAMRLAKKLNNSRGLERATYLKKYYRETERFTVRGKRAIEDLQTKPEDPGLNQTAGEYYCFVDDDFDKGAKHFVKSDESDWKLVGQMELKISESQQIGKEKQIADQWYKLGKQAKNFREKSAMKRAKEWYRKAINKADGLTRRVIEKRLKTIDALVNPY